MKDICIGIVVGFLLGILISAQFVNDYTFEKIIYTKITLSSLITGALCGAFSLLHFKAFQIFIGCIVIGVIVFIVKYLITGHNFNPLLMGSFTGTILGAIFYVLKKIYTRKRVYYRT